LKKTERSAGQTAILVQKMQLTFLGIAIDNGRLLRIQRTCRQSHMLSNGEAELASEFPEFCLSLRAKWAVTQIANRRNHFFYLQISRRRHRGILAICRSLFDTVHTRAWRRDTASL